MRRELIVVEGSLMKLVLVIVVLSSIQARGQSNQVFPLEVGNQWQYVLSEIYDTTYTVYNIFVSSESVATNGKSYAIMTPLPNILGMARYSDSMVYNYNNTTGDDQLIFDLAQSVGDTVSIYDSRYGGITDIFLRDINILPNYFGASRKLWTFHIAPRGMFDADELYKIAEGIGVISILHPWGWESGLRGAVIDGITYGTITDIRGSALIPPSFNLSQNYPNPVNPSTTIEVTLHTTLDITLVVRNILGQEIAELGSGIYPAGVHRFYWNPHDLPSGVYYYIFTTNHQSVIKKLTVIR